MQITNAPTHPHATPPAGSSRRHGGTRRRCLPAPAARLRVAGEPDEFAGRVTDLSHAGAGLELGRPVEVGREVTIILPGVGTNLSLVVAGRAVHCSAIARGTWRIGFRFAEAVQETFLGPVLRG
jgi:hypothetical protein